MSFTLCLFNTHTSCLFSCYCSENGDSRALSSSEVHRKMGSDGDMGCKSPRTLHIFASEFTSSLSSQDSPVVARWGNAVHPLQVEFGAVFSLLVTVYFALIFRVVQQPNKDFFPSNKVTAAQPPCGPRTCSIRSVTISSGSHSVAHAWSKLFLGHSDCFPTLGHNRRSFQQHFL